MTYISFTTLMAALRLGVWLGFVGVGLLSVVVVWGALISVAVHLTQRLFRRREKMSLPENRDFVGPDDIRLDIGEKFTMQKVKFVDKGKDPMPHDPP